MKSMKIRPRMLFANKSFYSSKKSDKEVYFATLKKQ